MKSINLLTASISSLSLRQETIQQAKAMGYDTLQGLFNTKKNEIFNKPGFTYRWFFEICDFLAKNNLLDEFDQL